MFYLFSDNEAREIDTGMCLAASERTGQWSFGVWCATRRVQAFKNPINRSNKSNLPMDPSEVDSSGEDATESLYRWKID